MSRYYPDHQKHAARSLRVLAKALNVTMEVEVIGESRTLRLSAPPGHIFGDEALHEFVDSTSVPWHPDYKDALDRLTRARPVPCPDPACEWCHPEE